jgi:hypothetical protein
MSPKQCTRPPPEREGFPLPCISFVLGGLFKMINAPGDKNSPGGFFTWARSFFLGCVLWPQAGHGSATAHTKTQSKLMKLTSAGEGPPPGNDLLFLTKTVLKAVVK